MTRLFLIGAFCLLCGMANAEPVDFESAKSIAAKTIGKSGVVDIKPAAAISSRMSVTPVEAPAFYMFNSEDGKGFAIISGDDEFPEVIGYSDKGQINVNGTLPDALVAYLEGYSRYVADVRRGIATPPVREGVGSATETAVFPLCTSTWGQSDPFNAYCPKVGVNRCPVGCIATAMAQIMYYYKHPVRPTGGSVMCDTGNKNIGFGGFLYEDFSTDEHIYQWDLMRNNVSLMSGADNEASRNAVAQLSYDCGIATNMQYATGGSGTTESEAAFALTEYFGYSPATTECIERNFVSTQEEWNAMVKKELDESRPVLYVGSSTKGAGSDAAGHAFIVDGYDKKGMVHVNWGWYGSSDGYFNITTLDMGEYAFSETQGMIYGIKPAVEGEKARQSRHLVFYGGLTTSSFYAQLGGKSVEFQTGAAYNFYAADKQWSIRIGLYDKYGKFMEYVTSVQSLPELGYLYGTNTGFRFSCTLPKTLSDGSKLADGDYALRILINEEGFNLPNGERDWILPYVVGGDKENWLPIMVKNGIAYIDQVSTPISSVEADGVEVVSSQYFDLNGRVIETPAAGSIAIERQTLSNGKTRSVKRLF